MIPELLGYEMIFNSTHRLFLRAIDGLTAEQALERRDGANPILWIAAHTVGVRSGFTRGLGGTVNVPWAKQFPRGGEVKDEASWPSLEEIRARWNEVHPEFMARLEAMTTEQALAPSELPGIGENLLSVVGLAAIHDAYHIGQLSAARRLHGLDRVVG